MKICFAVNNVETEGAGTTVQGGTPESSGLTVEIQEIIRIIAPKLIRAGTLWDWT